MKNQSLRAIVSICFLCVWLSLGVTASAEPELPNLPSAVWIWSSPNAVAQGEWECYFRKSFVLKAEPRTASLLITADNDYDLFVNGEFVGGDGGASGAYWGSVEKFDITELLKTGKNVIGILRPNTFEWSVSRLHYLSPQALQP